MNPDLNTIANALLQARQDARCVERPTVTHPGLTLTQAYEVAELLRQRRQAAGERRRGYKIGFTNRSIWDRYNVHAPIWAPVWDSTLTLLEGIEAEVSLAGLVQPRLEPEIVFGFARSPRAGMSELELSQCLDWVAHGVEVVHTHFDGWKFEAPDTVADFGLHGRLLVGPRLPVANWATMGSDLAALRLQLFKGAQPVEQGEGRNVLDGPLTALKIWVDALAMQPQAWPIEPGDVVTTGTLTDAWPLSPGEVWQTRPSDSRLAGLKLTMIA
jgi:2-oxo-3-hexenedioate decarboxylase